MKPSHSLRCWQTHNRCLETHLFPLRQVRARPCPQILSVAWSNTVNRLRSMFPSHRVLGIFSRDSIQTHQAAGVVLAPEENIDEWLGGRQETIRARPRRGARLIAYLLLFLPLHSTMLCRGRQSVMIRTYEEFRRRKYVRYRGSCSERRDTLDRTLREREGATSDTTGFGGHGATVRARWCFHLFDNLIKQEALHPYQA